MDSEISSQFSSCSGSEKVGKIPKKIGSYQIEDSSIERFFRVLLAIICRIIQFEP